ncbi:MAG: polysaccharide deacetylase family protein [Bacillota bacterium]
MSKKWIGLFVFTIALFAMGIASLNFTVNPFGAFAHADDWHAFNMTKNPRIAKISYLDTHHAQYDSYILGASSSSSFPVEEFNELYDANFYNLFTYGGDMYDVEGIAKYILENYHVENIVLNAYVGNGATYNVESHYLTDSLHHKTDAELSTFAYYCRYLFADPRYALEKIEAEKIDTLLVEPHDVFHTESGAYHKIVRDIEPIGSLDSYFEAYPVFLNYPTYPSWLPHTDEVIESIAKIKEMCDEKDVNLLVVTVPLYIEHLRFFDRTSFDTYFKKLAEITDFWDFTLSSASYEPRYFYDATHFRNNVGTMTVAKIMGDTETFISENLGTYVTTENVEEHLATQWEIVAEEALEAQLSILNYHHFTEEAHPDGGSTMSISHFEEQVKALVDNGYTGISFEELLDYVEKGSPLPEKPVILTFDDGYLSNYEMAYPILQKYNMKAVFFPIGSTIGLDKYKDTDYDIIPHYTPEQIVEMLDSGLVTFHSHTYDMHQWPPYEEGVVHETVMKLDSETEAEYIALLTNDHRTAVETLENITGEETNVISYPRGAFDDLSEVILKDLGVKVSLSTVAGVNTIVKGLPQTLNGLKRFTMDDTVSVEELLAQIEF